MLRSPRTHSRGHYVTIHIAKTGLVNLCSLDRIGTRITALRGDILPSEVVLDVGTINTARALLDPGRPPGPPGPYSDFDVSCAAQVLESIILFDSIDVPDIDGTRHEYIADQVEALGDALRASSVTSEEVARSQEQCKQWLADKTSVHALMYTIGRKPEYVWASTSSSKYQYLAAFGVNEKYSSRLPLIDEAMYRQTTRGGRGWRGKTLWEALASVGLPFIRLSEMERMDRYFSESEMKLLTTVTWAAYRSRQYEDYALAHESSYSPHPLRARISGYSSTTVTAGRLAKSPRLSRIYMELMESVYEEARLKTNRQLRTTIAPLNISPLLPYLAKKALWNRNDLLPIAYDLRDTKPARSLRQAIDGLQTSVATNDLSGALGFLNELDTLSQEFRASLRLAPSRQINFAVNIGGLFQVESPVNTQAKIFRRAKRLTGLRSPRLLFLRDVFAELSRAATLGQAYDMFYIHPKGVTT